MSQEQNNAGAAPGAPTVEQLQAQLAAQTEIAAKASERIAALETDARRTRLSALAAGFYGDVKAKVSFMEKLSAKFGEDSAELTAYVEDQNASAAQIKASGLFGESGSAASSADVSAGSAYGKLEAEAHKIAAAEGVSPERAFAKAAELNPALYTQYLNEQKG